MQIRKIRLLAPLAFWIFQVVVFFVRNTYLFMQGLARDVFDMMLHTFPIDCLTFCVFYFFFSPRFYSRKRLSMNILLVVLFFILNSGLWVLYYYLLGTRDPGQLRAFYYSSMGHNLLYAFYGILFRMGIDWFEERERKKELERQQAKTELALLRSQVNPHFLFNILNNIHSFSARDPEKTSFAIIKLADIMRYMLYDASAEFVPAVKEISYIRSYLDLQQLRYRNPDFVTFSAELREDGAMIPPLLFIPFIENAFKHGRKSSGDKIVIEIAITGSHIRFYCKNAKRELTETEQKMEKGIGIPNIRRRLDLLFPGSYTLEIKDEENHFTVSLIIQTHENQVHSH
jgi:sensor histidine kinase YesM